MYTAFLLIGILAVAWVVLAFRVVAIFRILDLQHTHNCEVHRALDGIIKWLNN